MTEKKNNPEAAQLQVSDLSHLKCNRRAVSYIIYNVQMQPKSDTILLGLIKESGGKNNRYALKELQKRYFQPRFKKEKSSWTSLLPLNNSFIWEKTQMLS